MKEENQTEYLNGKGQIYKLKCTLVVLQMDENSEKSKKRNKYKGYVLFAFS